VNYGKLNYCSSGSWRSTPWNDHRSFENLLVTAWMWSDYFPQTHMLNVWSQAGGIILEGSGNSRRWDLVGRSRWLEVCLWRLYLVPSPFLTLCFLPVRKWAASSSILSPCHDVLPHSGPRIYEAKDSGLKSLLSGAKINLTSLKLSILGILSQTSFI
jgi:hypothetical protein